MTTGTQSAGQHRRLMALSRRSLTLVGCRFPPLDIRCAQSGSPQLAKWLHRLQQCLFDFLGCLLLSTWKSGLVLFRQSCGLRLSCLCGRRGCDSDCGSDFASSRSNGLGCRYEHSFGRLSRLPTVGHMLAILAEDLAGRPVARSVFLGLLRYRLALRGQQNYDDHRPILVVSR